MLEYNGCFFWMYYTLGYGMLTSKEYEILFTKKRAILNEMLQVLRTGKSDVRNDFLHSGKK